MTGWLRSGVLYVKPTLSIVRGRRPEFETVMTMYLLSLLYGPLIIFQPTRASTLMRSRSSHRLTSVTPSASVATMAPYHATVSAVIVMVRVSGITPALPPLRPTRVDGVGDA
jgi:hypothetical protein